MHIITGTTWKEAIHVHPMAVIFCIGKCSGSGNVFTMETAISYNTADSEFHNSSNDLRYKAQKM